MGFFAGCATRPWSDFSMHSLAGQPFSVHQCSSSSISDMEARVALAAKTESWRHTRVAVSGSLSEKSTVPCEQQQCSLQFI